jgi:hypothetical protein
MTRSACCTPRSGSSRWGVDRPHASVLRGMPTDDDPRPASLHHCSSIQTNRNDRGSARRCFADDHAPVAACGDTLPPRSARAAPSRCDYGSSS